VSPPGELRPQASFDKEKNGLQPQPQEGASTRQQAALIAKRLRTQATTAAEARNTFWRSSSKSSSERFPRMQPLSSHLETPTYRKLLLTGHMTKFPKPCGK